MLKMVIIPKFKNKINYALKKIIHYKLCFKKNTSLLVGFASSLFFAYAFFSVISDLFGES